MSILLNLGTIPNNLQAKTFGLVEKFNMTDVLHLGYHEILIKSFLAQAEKVLTNTDLYENDPRLHFVKCVRSMKTVPGWNTTHKKDIVKRFLADISPTKNIMKSCKVEDVIVLDECNYKITIADFLILTHYVLVNTDLYEEDPRSHFVECVRSMKVVGKRLIAEVHTIK